MNRADDTMVIESSGNVFADLEIADSDGTLTKAELARTFSALVNARQLTQRQAVELLDLDQPKVSALMQGRLSEFSADLLLRFLMALDRHVEIVVTPEKEARHPGERRCLVLTRAQDEDIDGQSRGAGVNDLGSHFLPCAHGYAARAGYTGDVLFRSLQ